MEALAARQLVIVAGKGGVGKTTTSSAIALHSAAMGRRTLLVTVDPAKRLEDSLGVPVGFRETEIEENLTAMMLDPESVIRDHLAERIPDAKITDHPMFRFVTGSLPGLNELMAIGKLNDFRREGRYDTIVVDTAPTGHALSFLSVPKAMQEVMSEKSLLRWAIRGYQVWQKLSGAANTVGNLFKRKKETTTDIDFEAIFKDIKGEADKIQEFLTDQEGSTMVLVTLPEKLPVEETCDLYETVTHDLGMHVGAIVVNKMQPDTLAEHQARFDAIREDPDARQAFIDATAKATGEPHGLVAAIWEAAEFAEVRRDMNVAYLDEMGRRISDVPLVAVRLFKKDVQGLGPLRDFSLVLFDPESKIEARTGPAIDA